MDSDYQRYQHVYRDCQWGSHDKEFQSCKTKVHSALVFTGTIRQDYTMPALTCSFIMVVLP